MKLNRAFVLSIALAGATPTLAAPTVAIQVGPLPVPPARVDMRQKAAEALLKIPVYAVISRRFPDTYGRILDGISEGISAGKTIREIIVDVRPIYLDLLTREGPKADAENTRALMILKRDIANAALEKSPDACLAFWGLAKGQPQWIREIPQRLAEQDLIVAAKVLEQTAVRPAEPAKPVAEDVMENLGNKVVDDLPSNEVRRDYYSMDGDLTKAQSPGEKRAACLYLTGMVNALLALPGDEGPELFRSLASEHR